MYPFSDNSPLLIPSIRASVANAASLGDRATAPTVSRLVEVRQHPSAVTIQIRLQAVTSLSGCTTSPLHSVTIPMSAKPTETRTALPVKEPRGLQIHGIGVSGSREFAQPDLGMECLSRGDKSTSSSTKSRCGLYLLIPLVPSGSSTAIYLFSCPTEELATISFFYVLYKPMGHLNTTKLDSGVRFTNSIARLSVCNGTR
ncbi:hypothetical protein BJ878DRAFT_181937 [Calycina marina]|uniref:Uncharacterized protein n=1 Tax=Calycina marina TaxID=1763456 RepID=A0A9P7Z8F1_9HELO|nr:hypothetical protein BJ878DRAFT_181937 [Calycina marina]